MTSSDVLPATVSSAAAKPPSALALARRMASTTATPSAMPATVGAVRSRSCAIRRRRMNQLKSATQVLSACCRRTSMRSTLPVAHVDDAVGGGGDLGGVGRQQQREPAVAVEPAPAASRMRAPLAESRLPVGSSAMTQRRVVNHAPARWPRAASRRRTTASADGRADGPAPLGGPVPRALSNEACPRRRPAAAAARCFRRRLNVGSRLKNWKTNPSRSRRIRVSAVVGQRVEARSLQPDPAGGGPLHRAAHVQQAWTCRNPMARRWRQTRRARSRG